MRPLVVPLIVAAGAVLVMALDLALARRGGARRLGAALSVLVMAGALAASFLPDLGGTVAGGAYAHDAGVAFFQRLVLALGVICALGSVAFVAREALERQGEWSFLVLCSLLGMVLLPGARDLLLLVVCFELMGLPLYVLAGFLRDRRGAEAALKLFLVGAASTAVTLFGMSLVVGAAGSTRLAQIASAIAATGDTAAVPAPILVGGLMLMVAGMAFKLGVAPFHMWVPDTYQGASTPFVAFLSAAPKVAGVSAIGVLLLGAAPALRPAWMPALVAIAALTMGLGTFLALPQHSYKRLLAFSGVAHMGYLLLGLLAGSSAMGVVLFYLVAYTLTNVGAFLVGHAVADHDGGDDALAGLAGLARRQPWLAAALLVFLLSLAGIPFMVGFWAKLYVFIAAWQAGLGALVLAGALLSVLGLFFYLRVAREAYVSAPRPGRDGPVPVLPALRLAIALCLLGVIGLGLWPGPLVTVASEAGVAWMSTNGGGRP
jgi:NADH-quinone oxidoreductase subunit N